MTWATAALTSNTPTNDINDVIKGMCGASPIRNWSFVENIQAGVCTNEVQTIVLTSWDATDTIKFTYNGHETTAVTYASDVAAAIQAALIALDDFETGDLVVARTSATVYTVTFGATGKRFKGTTMLPITCTNGTGSATGVVEVTTPAHLGTGHTTFSADVFKCAGSGDDANSAGQDWYIGIERWNVSTILRLNLTTWHTGDTFKLTYNTHETSAITFSSDVSADILAALEGLVDFAPGDLTVTLLSHSPTNAATAVYLIKATDSGAVKFTELSALTVTSTSGCGGSVSVVVAGSNAETWRGTPPELEYSTTYKKFRKGIAWTTGHSTGSITVDANGFGLISAGASFGPTLWHYPNDSSLSASYTSMNWQMTLNKTGFTYQIKMTKDFIMIATRVGTTDKCAYIGLMDSLVASAIGDSYPLVIIGNGAVNSEGSTTGGFLTLPGVGAQANVSSLFGARAEPWTYNATQTTNASNANDKWQQNKIHAARVFIYHQVTAANYYIYGWARGLLKSDVLCVQQGGTVNIGDTMSIGGTTYTCMGPVSSLTNVMLFTPAS